MFYWPTDLLGVSYSLRNGADVKKQGLQYVSVTSQKPSKCYCISAVEPCKDEKKIFYLRALGKGKENNKLEKGLFSP